MKAFLILSALILFGAGFFQPGRAYAQQGGPEAAIEAWVDALATRDFDGALALLDGESFLIVSTRTSEDGDIVIYSGKEEIRSALQSYEMDNVAIELVEQPFLVMGTVTWTERHSSDSLRRLGILYLEYVGDAIVEGSKIKSIVYTPTPESVAKLLATGQRVGSMPTGMPRTGAGDLPFLPWALLAPMLVICTGMVLRFYGALALWK